MRCLFLFDISGGSYDSFVEGVHKYSNPFLFHNLLPLSRFMYYFMLYNKKRSHNGLITLSYSSKIV